MKLLYIMFRRPTMNPSMATDDRDIDSASCSSDAMDSGDASFPAEDRLDLYDSRVSRRNATHASKVTW